jgi:hypothetical protein
MRFAIMAAMRITLPHRFDFGSERELVGDDLLRPEAWDALRLQTSGAFSIPADLDQAADAHPVLRDRADAIREVLSGWDARHVVSYGVGTAMLERWLQRLAPELDLILTEYAPGTVQRLKQLMPEADVRQHDLLKGPVAADAHLFHRVDTELSNADWCGVYAAFAGQRIVVAASGVLTLRQAWHQRRRLRRLPSTVTNAGWARNRQAFEALWSATHRGRRFRCGDLRGWALTPLEPVGLTGLDSRTLADRDS